MLIWYARPEDVTVPNITFPDKNLETAIRDALGKPVGEGITAAELASLTEFSPRGRGITNLSGLEYCINLTRLRLYENEITDVSPLSSLTNLKGLGLSENQISDISPLSSLTNLTWLYLWDNQISDISALSSLTALTELKVSRNQISDISALTGLTNLEFLELGHNNISDIFPLVENHGLSVGGIVDLSGNPLSITSVNVYILELDARDIEVRY